MKMETNGKARTPLVALIVLALIFVALSAITYPSLSSESEGDNEREVDDTGTIEGQIIDPETNEPLAGVTVTITEQPPEEKEREREEDPDDPAGDKEREKDENGREGTRGDRDQDPEREKEKEEREKEQQRKEKEREQEKLEREKEQQRKEKERLQEKKENERSDIGDQDKRPRQWKTVTNERGFFSFQELGQGKYLLEVWDDGKVIYSTIIDYSGEEMRPLKIILKERYQGDDQREKGNYDRDSKDPERENEKRKDPGKDYRKPGNDQDDANVRPHPIPIHLHITLVDGDGDGLSDDAMVYASIKENKPLGGVMITIDGKFVGSTSYEGWLFSPDHRPGFHAVHAQYYEHQGKTTFLVGDIIIPPPEPRPWLGALKGIVLSDGGPVKEAIVILEPLGYIDGENDGEYRSDHYPPGVIRIDLREATTNERGEFFIEGLQPGRYVLTVEARFFCEYRDEVMIYPPHHLNDVEHIEIFLEPCNEPFAEGNLRGFIYHGDEPVPWGTIELWNDNFEARTETWQNGEFFIEGIPEGEYGYWVQAEGFYPQIGEVFIEGDHTREIRILLEPWGEPEKGNLKGFVYHEDEPIGDAIIELFMDDGLVVEAGTGETGEFLIEGIPEGKYWYSVHAEGFYEQEGEVFIEGDHTREIRILLEPWEEPEEGNLKGSVYHYYEPIAGAIIELFNDDELMAEAVTGEGGEFFIEGLPEGEHWYWVHAEGFHGEEGELLIEAGETTEINIFLEEEEPEEEGVLAGYVYHNDDPLIHAVIELFNDQSEFRAITGQEGKFRIEDIPVGAYHYMVFKEGFIEVAGEVEIHHVEVTTIHVELEKDVDPEEPGAIYGWIFDQEENRIDNAVITAQLSGKDIAYVVESNVYGHFSILEMIPGEYEITIECEGYKPHTGEMVILPGTTHEITVILEELDI